MFCIYYNCELFWSLDMSCWDMESIKNLTYYASAAQFYNLFEIKVAIHIYQQLLERPLILDICEFNCHLPEQIKNLK